MKKQIELNKRPQGTFRLPDQEIDSIRQNLYAQKSQLGEQIEHTSVTLYTTRAKPSPSQARKR